MNHDEPAARSADAHAAPFDADDSIAPPLSAAGQARRDAMLGDLLGSMRRVHARRRARRVGAAGLAVVACVGIGVVALRPSSPAASNDPAPRTVESPRIAESPRPRVAPVAPSGPVIEYAEVRTDDSSLDRLRARRSGVIERIGDDALLATLADLGRPTGLIRTAGGVRVADAVVDPPAGRGEG